MKSRFFHLKEKAVQMRREGSSLKDIERALGIPRSTLSGWLKKVHLSAAQKRVLKHRWKLGLVKARKKAVEWHRAGRVERLAHAKESALLTLKQLGTNYEAAWELALAFLYLGEGAKKSEQTSLGSSDEQILKFFVASLKHLYHIEPHELKCELHLRADQSPKKMKLYWSRTLSIPLKNFGAATRDQRTAGRKTYQHYKGVCIVRAPGIAIQRKLVYISREFCNHVSAEIIEGAVSSVGRASD